MKYLDAERLADIARAGGDVLWECDMDWRYTWVAGLPEPLGSGDAEALIGQPLADGPLLDSHGDALGDQRLYHCLAQPRPFAEAVTEVRTPRSRVMVSRSAVPLFDAQGRHAGWRGTARDVSVRVALARSERERDERLRKLTALLPGALYQYHEPDGPEPASGPADVQAAGPMFGLQTPLLLGPLRLHPGDLPTLRAAYLRARGAQLPWQVQFRALRADGEERWLESRAMPERSPDGGWLWHGFVTDITEQRQVELALRASEERWLLAAEATATGLAQFHCRDRTLLLDRMGCLNHGLPWPHPPLRIDDWLATLHADDRPLAEAALQRAETDGERMEARFRFHLPDGSLRWLEIFARAQQGPDGDAVTIVGTCRDVTAQQEAVQLQRAKEEAERANRAKSELLSRVSHELRTPLNGILGFAQLMGLDREQPLGTAQRRRLEGVEQAGRHLLALVNDVLDLTRLERGEFGLHPRPIDLVQSLAAALGMVRPLLSLHPAQLPLRLPPGPVWVQADPRGLEQVLVNLLSNAIKYNRPQGQVRFELRLLPLQAVLTIEDEGAGLTEDEQRQLFQPFNRLGAERQRIEGTGLGLVIASELVRTMNGALSVTSRSGVGSRFSVALARAHEVAPQADPVAEPPPYRVVYIEDEPLNALLMQEVFRAQRGWQLVVARNGTEGLDRVRSLLPDMVLVDMNLPDLSGLQVIAALRADPRTAGLRCVALSADAMADQIDVARRAGFDDYWTKPIDVARMLHVVEQAIRTRP
ncbi:PAS domain-containing protein [Aquincola tertiaricarbonis]|uniref:histidine kinase n=1 Tax=Aquincola tertiaricarbonis TaxID=391953 RepID=A0ABY4SH84_AQUTE|nr:hybrid sensor histidine kinase/response regulator [Aquincola tertiaricarbonis]URI10356.1 PAS domain-containing protein [Aquincola tertiaricarbonis]